MHLGAFPGSITISPALRPLGVQVAAVVENKLWQPDQNVGFPYLPADNLAVMRLRRNSSQTPVALVPNSEPAGVPA